MIDRISAAPTFLLAADIRADLIYEQARAEANESLWQAVMTDTARRAPASDRRLPTGDAGLRSLLVLLGGDLAGRVAAPVPPPLSAAKTVPDAADHKRGRGDRRPRRPSPVDPAYADTIAAAAARTGLPAAALTAIIHAEAATDGSGRWQTMSRNPHSSAAGLGQFLSGTWVSEAERAGTWLHAAAAERGWLNPAGRVLAQARSSLLALRYDGVAAIEAVADYATHNLAQLRRAGLSVGNAVTDLARVAYLGHHLGSSDALRFLTGQIEPGRAKALLRAQIGDAAAAKRIAESGDAVVAHRHWLSAYVARAVERIS